MVGETGRVRGRRQRPPQAWQRLLTWTTLGGLTCALAQWGWRTPLAVALTLAGAVALLGLLLHLDGSDPTPVDVGARAGQALEAGAVLVAVGGWFAASLPVGLLVVAVLAVAAPRVRRGARDLVAVLRWSRRTAHGLRWTGSRDHGDVHRP